MPFPILLLAAALAPAEGEIIVTGSREPVAANDAAASSTIFDDDELRALGLPNAADVLRLAPAVSVATTGPRGSQTQLRIRGAEANHTLLFIDGIRFNDPASGNEPRFELLNGDTLARLEIVRGPQSALWGAEALGGVIAVRSADPFSNAGLLAEAEYGSLDSSRLFGRYTLATGDIGLSGSGGWQRSDGIDSFGGGERDGFDNRAASLQGVYRNDGIEVGAVGHWLELRSAYDGFSPITFLRANTLDETDNRIGAARLWGAGTWDVWTIRAEASYLDSVNRNSLAGAPLNQTFGDRLTLGGQVARRLGDHQLIAAIDHQDEGFRARDTSFGGGTNQDRSRRNTAFVGQWRAEWLPGLITDLAVRHDAFSVFEDATTFRASLLARPGAGFTLYAAYGEGIAQPTFFDLFGFFPGSFAGNPTLRPESSRGWEVGVRWETGSVSIGATGFSSRLTNEIIDIFNPVTFTSSTANAAGRSRRGGAELDASWRHAEWLTLTANYTWLDADQQIAAGALLVREVRRPRHSFNLTATGTADRFSYGASLAYVGKRRDTDFDLFPAATVTLGDYALASLRVGYRLLPNLEAFGRIENGFDADYQDVVGYNTPGRTVHAGLRITLGR